MRNETSVLRGAFLVVIACGLLIVASACGGISGGGGGGGNSNPGTPLGQHHDSVSLTINGLTVNAQ
jgi:hypothetical protein